MGIQGLLPFLKPFVKKVNIEEFRGKKLGVDAMCWMHKGAFACAKELVEGVDTDRFIIFFLRMCEVLRATDIKPVIVFDGARLPAKAAEETLRNDSREKNRAEAIELIEKQKRGESIDERRLAAKCDGAIKITQEMISRLMTALTELSIPFCVAPFEADAQLAYLCRIGRVDAVISEDSDLLAYGCPSTIFKMDKYGNGDNIVLPCLQKDHAPQTDPAVEEESSEEEEQAVEDDQAQGEDACVETEPAAKAAKGRGRGRGRGVRGKKRKSAAADAADGEEAAAAADDKADQPAEVLALNKWSAEKFTQMCIFGGTDYKEPDIKIKGFGLKTAFKLLKRFPSVDRMLCWMREDKKWQERLPCAPTEFMSRFSKVLAVFYHHVVFDESLGRCTSIARSFGKVDRHIPGIDITELCGTGPDKKFARKVWNGFLSARTFEPRPGTPLTPAERKTLDRILQQKRSEQRQYNFEQQLKNDAAEIAAQRAREQAAAAAKAEETPVDDELAFLLTGQSQADVEPPVPTLRDGDAQVLMRLVNSAEETKAPASNPFARRLIRGTPTQSSSSTGSNPFARKRAVPDEEEVSLNQNHPTKCIRTLGDRRAVREASIFRPEVRPIATPSQQKPEARPLAQTELGPRGGGAAKDAAEVVLAQRGMGTLAQLAPNKDKRRLTGWFGLTKQQAEAEEQQQAKPSALAEWKARPWEPDEEDDEMYSNLNHNPLSLRKPTAKTFAMRNW